jgi:hypothetical protein
MARIVAEQKEKSVCVSGLGQRLKETDMAMRRCGESGVTKPIRFGAKGVAGLWSDKTRPSRIPPLDPKIAAGVVALAKSVFHLATDIALSMSMSAGGSDALEERVSPLRWRGRIDVEPDDVVQFAGELRIIG